jgi:hypothetical protein
MSEIDGVDYCLEQIRQGVEGADYTTWIMRTPVRPFVLTERAQLIR